jgi:hypothetical protein
LKNALDQEDAPHIHLKDIDGEVDLMDSPRIGFDTDTWKTSEKVSAETPAQSRETWSAHSFSGSRPGPQMCPWIAGQRHPYNDLLVAIHLRSRYNAIAPG